MTCLFPMFAGFEVRARKGLPEWRFRWEQCIWCGYRRRGPLVIVWTPGWPSHVGAQWCCVKNGCLMTESPTHLWTIWNDVWSDKRREITERHNTRCHLGRSEVRILNLLCIPGYAHMKCWTLSAFSHLSERQTSFQALCWYVIALSCRNCLLHYKKC